MPGGIGYTFRQLRDAIDKLDESQLDGPALVVGVDYGFDFIGELKPLEFPIRVGPDAHHLFKEGTPALHLQDDNIE